MSKPIKCAWVENMISIDTDGWSRPCCGEPSVSARISKIENGILTAFNHPDLLLLRDNLANNGYSSDTRAYCSRCEQLENKNQPSLQTGTGFLSNKRELKLIQFKLSNKCQLTCAHCGPDLSSGWAKLLDITPRVKNSFNLTDAFLKELSELLPQLDVIKFTGGEPFLDPMHWGILEYLSKFDRSNCKLVYITNGISPFRPKLWKGWKSVECSVSVDGFQESYEWFRRGSAWDEVVTGVNNLKKFADVTVNFAMTPYTVQDYHVSKSFWGSLDTYLIVHPSHASMINFPMEKIKQLSNYQDIPHISAATGTDLTYYKEWALSWDTKWNTVGWANKLFWWMHQ